MKQAARESEAQPNPALLTFSRTGYFHLHCSSSLVLLTFPYVAYLLSCCPTSSRGQWVPGRIRAVWARQLRDGPANMGEAAARWSTVAELSSL